jgi:hypothetical protein
MSSRDGCALRRSRGHPAKKVSSRKRAGDKARDEVQVDVVNVDNNEELDR